MNETTQTILSLLAHVLFGKPLPAFPPSVDWEEVFRECRTQAVAVLFTDILDRLPLSDELRLKWQYCSIRGTQNALSILKVQEELHNVFSAENIRYATVKGFAAAKYYPQPEYRTMGDVDIIVLPGDFEKAERLLTEHGFEWVDIPDHYDPRHVPYTKRGVLLELHRYFAATEEDYPEDKLLNDMLNRALPDAAVNEHRMAGDGGVYHFRVLPDFENGLVLLEHIVHHIPSGLGYRQIIDFLIYANTCLDDSVWFGTGQTVSDGGFGGILRELHMEKLAKVCARMGQLYFGMGEKITWCTDIDDNLCGELLDYLTVSGNFGKKDETGDGRISFVLRATHGSPLTILKYEQRAGLTYWNAVKRFPVLKPFAWIYGCGRHLRILLREKKVREVFRKLPAQDTSASIVSSLEIHDWVR